MPAIPKVVKSKLPTKAVRAAIDKIPDKNPRKDLVDKARELDVIGKFLGLDFVGLVDFDTRSELVKRVVVLGLAGGSVGGLGLQIFLGLNKEKFEKEAEEKAKAAEAAKKAQADAAAATAKAKADAAKKVEDDKAAAKKKADDEVAAKKKAADEAAKKKAEDEVIAKKQAEVKAAADARQVVVDTGARKKAYTTKDYVEGSAARRRALMKQYNYDASSTGMLR